MAQREKLDHLEERLRVVEGGEDYAFANLEELFLVPNVVILPKFKVSYFDKYKRTTCPKTHYQCSAMKKMVGYTPSSFVDLVFTGERIEVGQKRGKFDHPALTNEKIGANEEDENEGETHVVAVIPTQPNFPPAQQCHYSANINPSHYPPPNHPQRSSLNQP